MNDLPTHDRGADTSQAEPAQGLLARIETLLHEQWRQVREGNIDAAYELGRRIDALIPRVLETKGIATDPEAHRRLDSLCHTIELALAQQTAEVAGRRARLQTGRTVRKAYSRGSTL